MINSLNSEFLRTKIMECGQALIYRCIDEINKQILGFKKEFDIDNHGQLYFNLGGYFANRYSGDLFPVEFFFYKKGMPYYITAKGIAVRTSPLHALSMRKLFPAEKILRVQIDSIEFVTLCLKKKSFFSSLTSIFGEFHS